MVSLHDRLNAALAGRYRVDRQVGAGGMATVHVAHDLRHGREVAVKVLRPELGAVLGVARFLEEIRVVARLQHPHVLPLFDSGDADGLLFYVMPFVAGESLRTRIAREKQLPVTDALHIAEGVAAALDYAHRHDVIHRDLKPENILFLGGEPVLADFGIALAVSRAAGDRITETGISLGTPQYMSPEQATGDRALDSRTDVYSLGVVTYEMLTGELPHTGVSAQAIISRVLLDRAPRVSASRESVAFGIDTAVARALEKVPADRWPTAGEFARELRLADVPRPGADRGQSGAPRRARWASVSGAVALAITAGAAGALVGGLAARRFDGGSAEVFSFDIAAALTGRSGFNLAVAPDGKSVVFLASAPGGDGLYRREVDHRPPVLLAGTDGATAAAISPNGEWLAVVRNGDLLRMPATGGPAAVLARVDGPNGLAWASDETLVLGGRLLDPGLKVVPAAGGAVTPLTTPDTSRGEIAHNSPRVLPDGETILYSSGTGIFESGRIGIASLRTGESTILDLAGWYPLGVLDGHLFYVDIEGAIKAVRIDVRRRRLTSEPVLIERLEFRKGPGAVALSATGTLAHVSGAAEAQLVLVDSGSRARPLITSRDDFFGPKFSSDGRRVAVAIGSFPQTGIWVHHIDDGASVVLTPASSLGWALHPTWSPDGRVVFSASRAGKDALWSQPADASGPPEMLAATDTDMNEATFSLDGRLMAYRRFSAEGLGDIEYRSPPTASVGRPLLNSRYVEMHPSLSPDGSWIAYVSNETGLNQVYVRAVQGEPRKSQVSPREGVEPRWSADGRRLFYRSGAGEIVAATISETRPPSVASARVVLRDVYARGTNHHLYDVSPDGASFVFVRRTDSATVAVTANWIAEVRARLPRR